MTHLNIKTGAALAGAVLLLAAAVYVHHNRYAFIQDPFGAPFFWDSKVFMAGGQIAAAGGDPYADYVWREPFPLPFISPPAFTHLLAAVSGAFGAGVFDLLAFGHIVALIAAPLMLSRWFLGAHWAEAGLGYGLFLAGFGAWGVTTVLAGNFGSSLYLFVFGGLAYQRATGRWWLFHLAVICACQVKMPYALFWAIPVMVNGWDWRQFRHCALAGLLAAAPYAASALAEPGMFGRWLEGLARQVETGDVGLSVYGGAWSKADPDSRLPMIVHGLAMSGAFLLVLTDRARGPMRLAALIVLIILANPRMKEYDIAFAAIPAAALYIAAFTATGASERRKALAIGAVLALMAVLLKADRAPLIGPYVYALGLIGALAALRFAPRPPAERPALA